MREAKLEVCVDSVESAVAAFKGGATRIELCAALSEGGLTPTPGLLKTIKTIENINIPIFCMLRPRCGNDFQYSDSEMEVILFDLQILKDAGSDGFVFGALNANGNVNVEQCRKVIIASGNLPVTFHRAFDATNPENFKENCEIIESLGFQRILTSGFSQTAEIGLENLKKLTEFCADKNLIIMPGAGINTQNAEVILKETNCKEFHGSAKMNKFITVNSGGSTSVESIMVTSLDRVKELVAIGKSNA